MAIGTDERAIGGAGETTAVVTGGSGFIASHLIADLDRDPRVGRIFVLDNVPPRFHADKLVFVGCDLRQEIGWLPPEPSSPLRCFHLAGICREPGYPWDDYFTGNSLIAGNVAKWASRIGLDNIVFTSTAMVFKASDERNSELDLPNPDTGYGISKVFSEEILRTWAAADSNRRLHVLRPGVVFGKGCGENFVRLYKAVKRNLFCYVGRNSTVKSAIYVKDLVRIMRAASDGLLAPGTYHTVYPEALTIGQICETFCRVYGWRRHIPTLPYRALRLATLPFQFASEIGLKNPIHPRRVEKLYQSNNLSADKLMEANFSLAYALAEAIRDWREDCSPLDLY